MHSPMHYQNPPFTHSPPFLPARTGSYSGQVPGGAFEQVVDHADDQDFAFVLSR